MDQDVRQAAVPVRYAAQDDPMPAVQPEVHAKIDQMDAEIDYLRNTKGHPTRRTGRRAATRCVRCSTRLAAIQRSRIATDGIRRVS